MIPALSWILGCGEPATSESTPKDSETTELDTQDTVDTHVDTAETDTGETDTAETGETGDTDTAGPLCNELDTADGEVPRCDRSRPWTFVDGGAGITCGIHDDGCAECWGIGEAEEKYLAGYTYRHEDIPPAEGFVSIGMHGSDSYGYGGGIFLCGVTTDGRIRCWADGLPAGMLEIDGDFVDVAVWSLGAWAVGADGALSPINVGAQPEETGFVAVRSGRYDMVALGADGGAHSFDFQYDFQEDRPGPYVAVDAGEYVCGLRVDGTLECWNTWSTVDLSTEPIVADAPTGLVDFCQTLYAACGLDAEGYVTCWGDSKWFPGNWPTDIQFSQLGCGVSHACGITPEGEMHCWSDQDYYCETVVPS